MLSHFEHTVTLFALLIPGHYVKQVVQKHVLEILYYRQKDRVTTRGNMHKKFGDLCKLFFRHVHWQSYRWT